MTTMGELWYSTATRVAQSKNRQWTKHNNQGRLGRNETLFKGIWTNGERYVAYKSKFEFVENCAENSQEIEIMKPLILTLIPLRLPYIYRLIWAPYKEL